MKIVYVHISGEECPEVMNTAPGAALLCHLFKNENDLFLLFWINQSIQPSIHSLFRSSHDHLIHLFLLFSFPFAVLPLIYPSLLLSLLTTLKSFSLPHSTSPPSLSFTLQLHT